MTRHDDQLEADTLLIRFSTVPPFGIGAIRRFPDNVTNTSQRPARYFEDVLQVRIGLFMSLGQ